MHTVGFFFCATFVGGLNEFHYLCSRLLVRKRLACDSPQVKGDG